MSHRTLRYSTWHMGQMQEVDTGSVFGRGGANTGTKCVCGFVRKIYAFMMFLFNYEEQVSKQAGLQDLDV